MERFQSQIRLRRATAAVWTARNPVLGVGEPGYETDTGKLKVGDGQTAWSSLSYFAGSGVMVAGGAPSPADSTAVMWTASGSGTKDGQAYAEADVLVTSVDSSGTSKTVLILDHSAL